MVSADSEEIWGREEVTGQVVRNVGPSCCHQFPSRPVCNPVSANTARLNHSRSEVLNMLLRQLSYAMKTQLKTTKTPMGISCLSLCLYGIRVPIRVFFCARRAFFCHEDTVVVYYGLILDQSASLGRSSNTAERKLLWKQQADMLALKLSKRNFNMDEEGEGEDFV